MIFVDSNIPMYAAGKASPFKEDCISFLQKIEKLKVRAVSSAEVLQEILHRFHGLRRIKDGIEVYRRFRALPIHFLPIEVEAIDDAKDILQTTPRLSSRDALHLAVMRRHGIRQIATYDQDFLGIPHLSVFLPDQV